MGGEEPVPRDRTSAVLRVGPETHFARDLMNVPQPVALVRGNELIYEFANEAWRTLMGMDDPIGDRFGQSAIDFEGRAHIEARLRTVLMTGEPLVFKNLEVTTPSGMHRVINSSILPTQNDAGEIDGLLMTAVDVTEFIVEQRELLKRAEEAERFESIVHAAIRNAHMILVASDANGNILLAEGKAISDLPTGLVPAQGENLFRDRAERDAIAEGLRQALIGTETDAEIDAASRLLRAVFSPLLTKDRTICGSVCVAIDVTEETRGEDDSEKMKERLVQLQKVESLGVLAGGIAHDFNNLLTAIIGNASHAQLELPPDNPVRATLHDILLTSRRAAALSRQMLAYSGKGHFDIKRVDLSMQVSEITHLLDATVPKKIEMRQELAPEPLVVEVDVAELQQVVMNLVINGAEAIGAGRGTITVRTGLSVLEEPPRDAIFESTTWTGGRYAFVEIEDTGCGMSAATKARIFDPFFTTKFSGRGLGLAAVLGIVRGHQGTIVIDSSEGRGSRFRVYIPASSEALETTRTPPPVAFQGSGVVLIVDDEPAVRSAARRILQRMGFATLEAAHGREAVELFRAHTDDISVVILDMTMPEMNGDEALRLIREIDPDAPVLISSGYNDIESSRPLQQATGFLLKPYTPQELAERLREAIRSRETRGQ